jgi:hypothetical protein
MKLRLRLWSSPYLSPATANSSPRLRRTLFATTKKPASLAGFRYLRLGNSHLIALFLSPPHFSARLAPFSSLFKLQLASDPA